MEAILMIIISFMAGAVGGAIVEVIHRHINKH